MWKPSRKDRVKREGIYRRLKEILHFFTKTVRMNIFWKVVELSKLAVFGTVGNAIEFSAWRRPMLFNIPMTNCVQSAYISQTVIASLVEIWNPNPALLHLSGSGHNMPLAACLSGSCASHSCIMILKVGPRVRYSLDLFGTSEARCIAADGTDTEQSRWWVKKQAWSYWSSHSRTRLLSRIGQLSNKNSQEVQYALGGKARGHVQISSEYVQARLSNSFQNIS